MFRNLASIAESLRTIALAIVEQNVQLKRIADELVAPDIVGIGVHHEAPTERP